MSDTIVYFETVPTTVVLPSELGIVVIGDDTTTVVVDQPDYTVIGPDIPGPAGPQGPAGPAGPSGGGAFIRTAAQALSGHRVVKTVGSNSVDYASSDQSADALLIEGITTGAAESGADAEVQGSGEIVEPSWTWTLGPVFCGPNGQLTQSPPTGPWIRQVATAVDPTRIIVALQPPIFTT